MALETEAEQVLLIENWGSERLKKKMPKVLQPKRQEYWGLSIPDSKPSLNRALL